MNKTVGVNRPSLALEAVLWPPSALYSTVASLRNRAFDFRWRETVQVGAKVISIGNVTAGGTGKTPVTAWLVERLQERGRNVGIVSRGYGGVEKGPAPVPTDGSLESAVRFGDEPSWLAVRFPEVPVVICGDRVKAARELLSRADVDVILADDAFQHRHLGRALDIVVLDATEPEWHYRPLPLGRLRESFSALTRARVLFITKVNLASAEKLRWLRSRIADELKGHGEPPLVIEFESRIEWLAPLGAKPRDPGIVKTADLSGEKIILASAIGRPQAFESLLTREAKVQVVAHEIFPDHHAFTRADLRRIENRAAESGAARILVTEKDATKLQGWEPRVSCLVARLEMKPRDDLKALYEEIDRVLL